MERTVGRGGELEVLIVADGFRGRARAQTRGRLRSLSHFGSPLTAGGTKNWKDWKKLRKREGCDATSDHGTHGWMKDQPTNGSSFDEQDRQAAALQLAVPTACEHLSTIA